MDHSGHYEPLMDNVDSHARRPPSPVATSLRAFCVGYGAITILLVLPCVCVVATQGWNAPCDHPLLLWACIHISYHVVKGFLLGAKHCTVLVLGYPTVMRAASRTVKLIELFGVVWWFQGAQWLCMSETCNTSVYRLTASLFVIQTIFLLIPLISLVICLPLFSAYVLVLLYMNPQSPSQRATSEEVIKKISRYAWNSAMRRHQTIECSICLTEFQDGEEVMELPCATRHLFHTICALPWLRTSQHCPLCRLNIADIFVDDENRDDL
eukprot:GEMP01020686.1.p1 GENE.GEMP01020686.1~~GEMP01020686.1.p1  ORF type:complete len:267 (-),score=29.93 GEMP01020686.1:1636-2436(-)